MSLTLNLPPSLEQQLRERAAELGQPVDKFVIQAIEQKLARPSLEELFGPLHEETKEKQISAEEWDTTVDKEVRLFRKGDRS